VHNEILTLPEGVELGAERRFGKATVLLVRRATG
jgi:hypothetical protein